MDFVKDLDFKQWLVDLKSRIRQSQLKAMIRVNDEMLRLYWSLGHDIVVRQMDAVWGSGFFKQLSKELKSEFPDMQGFSDRNLYNMKQFYLFYSQDDKILQQVVAKLENEIRHQVGDELKTEIFHQSGGKIEDVISHQVGAKLQRIENKDIEFLHQVGAKLDTHPIFQIPWRHHVEIFTKCKSVHEAMFYVQKIIQNGWSRAMLMNFMETDLYQRQGKALNNFDRFLPDVQSDLAKEILKKKKIQTVSDFICQSE